MKRARCYGRKRSADVTAENVQILIKYVFTVEDFGCCCNFGF